MKYLDLWSPGLRKIFSKIYKTLHPRLPPPPPPTYLMYAPLMLPLWIMWSCRVEKCWLKLLTVSEALALSVLNINLEMQMLQSGKAFSTKDKSLSNTILDVSLMVLFVPICSITCFGYFFNRDLMQSYMFSVVATGKDFTLTFLHWRDILFPSIQDTIKSPTMSVWFLLRLWWISFSKLTFLKPLNNFTSCCLVVLKAVWYCWRISFSWWSNLALLICPCSCCWVSSDQLLFSLYWLLTSSLTVLQFWKFSKICFAEVTEGAAVILPHFIDSYSEQLKIY